MTPESEQPLGVGVIGLGFMGAVHVAAYQAAQRDGFGCRLVAVCDTKSSRREGKLWDVGGNLIDTSARHRAFQPERVSVHAAAEDLLADPHVHLVSICTHTDTHVRLAVAALRAGKHVLVEKPVALNADEIREVESAAREARRLCMPGMCLRFWPEWVWLKKQIDRGTYGRCIGLTLTRVGAPPTWAQAFYANPARSGGALVDLHIHDADFVRFLFGDPAAVTSTGRARDGAINHITTLYEFTGDSMPQHVVAEGGWLSPGTPFRMRYIAEFEHATAEYDITRTPSLMLYRDGEARPVEVSKLNGYDEEIRYLVNAIALKDAEVSPSLADAIAVAELLDAERRSVESRQRVGFEPRAV